MSLHFNISYSSNDVCPQLPSVFLLRVSCDKATNHQLMQLYHTRWITFEPCVTQYLGRFVAVDDGFPFVVPSVNHCVVFVNQLSYETF